MRKLIEDIAGAVEKRVDRLSKTKKSRSRFARRMYSEKQPVTKRHMDMKDRLEKAEADDRWVKLHYSPIYRKAYTSRAVLPLYKFTESKAGNLSFLAWDPGRNNYRRFRLDRIRHLKTYRVPNLGGLAPGIQKLAEWILDTGSEINSVSTQSIARG